LPQREAARRYAQSLSALAYRLWSHVKCFDDKPQHCTIRANHVITDPAIPTDPARIPWGGRRLAELGKPIGDGDHYAESWEVVDHGADQSIVVNSELAGTQLHKLVTTYGPELLGRHNPRPQFPLLFKYLDCQRTLSVQVHPNDEQGAKLNPPDLGKTEAWVVLAAEPDSCIYAGLKPQVDRTMLERELARGNCEACLHEFQPRVGDCVFIEAGTVHALGAGLLVAEIQQASNTTFRLFDWNRLDADGKPRPLHVGQSLNTIDYCRGPVNPVTPRSSTRPNVERLATCDKFVLDRWCLDSPQVFENDERFHIVTVIEGVVTLGTTASQQKLRRGDTRLIPACCPTFEMVPRGTAVLLDMYLP
jgi:mannose-6-phosphate isomerase